MVDLSVNLRKDICLGGSHVTSVVGNNYFLRYGHLLIEFNTYICLYNDIFVYVATLANKLSYFKCI